MASRHTSYEPLPRSRHVAVAVGSKLHIWGGDSGSKEKSRELSQHVEMFDTVTELWEQKLTHGTPPPGLRGTAYTVVGTHLYNFGGWDGISHHNSLHKLDLCTLQWDEIKDLNSSSVPQRKTGSRLVSYEDKQLVLFAGWTGNQWTKEIHVFNLEKGEWSSPAVTGTTPPPLEGFSFTKVDHRRAVVYGGTTRGIQALGDAYVLQLDTWHWSKLDITGRLTPPARLSHAACCIAGPLTGQEHPLLLVGGGCGGDYSMEIFKDLWVLDVDGGVWHEVSHPKNMEPRYSHTVTVFGSGHNCRMVVMYGGRRKVGGPTIAETTLLHLEWHGSIWKLSKGRWEVTKVVRKWELGRPVERLREQMERLQLSLSDRTFTRLLEERLAAAEERIRGLERERYATDMSLRRLEEEKHAAEARAEEIERSTAELRWIVAARAQELDTFRQRAEEAERRARDADNATTTLIRQITADANQRLMEAEAQAWESHQRATQAEQRATQAEQWAIQAEQRATQAETEAHFLQQGTPEIEARTSNHFCTVQRDEIQFTDQELGRGGWAVVKVAKFRGLQVAAKCLHTLIVSDYNRQLFVREMSIAARVHHPNLVQFIGATVEGEPVILTELMTTSLRAVLERRPFNHAQITSISLDVARALNYLHLMQPDPIIHRDISSANVLLEPGPSNSWRAKVSDYGSTNFLQQLRTTGPGSPAYAAPEADIPSQQSPKMDVYSYGVLLLEMCSQRFPNREEFEALLQQVQQPTMVALIHQCMEHEPTRRPTMSDVIGHLERETC